MTENFWKRVYESTKNIFVYAKKGVVPVFGAVILYLIGAGLISEISDSGDSVCAGTLADPCIAYINITSPEYSLILPKGTVFTTEPEIDCYTFHFLDSEWKEYEDRIILSQGLNQLKFICYKPNPTMDVYWTFSNYLKKVE